MNNLENLRKQAKKFVRWHRERVWTVAEVIRNGLPRYGSLSDREILDAPFKLADAQELVARREGFESWAELVASFSGEGSAGSSPAPSSSECARARVLVARPFVFVRDVDAACRYYEETLGFEVAFRYGSPPFYAEIERDGVRLCVRHTDGPMIDPTRALQEDVVPLSIEVDDAKLLYLELQKAGARFSQPLRTEPYGPRSFILDDLDGNRLLFFEVRQARGEAAAQG